MRKKELLVDVWNDVQLFLKKERDEVFYNERELQVALALYLENTERYKKIYLEYYVPVYDNNKNELLSDYPWKSEIRLDLVVAYGDYFIPIELKYKTKKIEDHNITRFGELVNDVDIIKDQSAQDLGCYHFWKDVKRIEVVTHHYNRVLGGIALFVTNDSNYFGKKKSNAAYYNFRLSDDNHGTLMQWINDPAIKKTHPNFGLSREYHPHWMAQTDTKLPDGFRCFYCLI